MTEKLISLKGFVWTFVGLVVLAVLSFGLSYLRLGAWETPVAIVIAFLKAGMVAFVFMELIEAKFVVRLAAVVVVGWIVLLISLMVLDIETRIGPGIRPPVPLVDAPPAR